MLKRGILEIKNIARNTYLTDASLAKVLVKELNYWIDNEPNTKG